ncbi:MAG: PIN domain-containing protein [Planctomycetales bacterium]|nr:PIN domain-containing protein [Planctomycetales bacterium]
MSDSLFADAVFVIALINKRDQYHAVAQELAHRFAGQHLVITDAVLLEIGNGLASSFRKEAAQVIDSFLTSADVEVVRLFPDLFDDGLDLYRVHQDKEWGLVDCLSFVVMRERKIRGALTFDHHFVQAGFEALMRSDN